MALETEIARYEELLPELFSSDEGKYAVIAGRELVGVFDNSDAGYAAGLERVGVQPFLLRKITKDQPVIWLPTLMFGRRRPATVLA